MSDHEHSPYLKIFAWLTIWTVLEIAIALEVLGLPRLVVVLGLGVMAAIKAALVGLYYMHLKYEGKLIWVIIFSPIVLLCILAVGFYWDAAGYYPR